jgi:hypothetical protein
MVMNKFRSTTLEITAASVIIADIPERKVLVVVSQEANTATGGTALNFIQYHRDNALAL